MQKVVKGGRSEHGEGDRCTFEMVKVGVAEDSASPSPINVRSQAGRQGAGDERAHASIQCTLLRYLDRDC